MKKPKKPNLPKRQTVEALERYMDSEAYGNYRERMKKFNAYKKKKSADIKKKVDLKKKIREGK